MTNYSLPNFRIKERGKISECFIELRLYDFHTVLKFVGELPYGRNSNRTAYELVISEKKGTCSTKHALLSALCKEQGIQEIKLITGIYEMNENNTPGVGSVLEKYVLSSVPEAHCYLKYKNNRFDFTRLDVIGEPIEEFLIEEEIQPEQIGTFKTEFHRSYIPIWLSNNKLNQRFDLESLWKVREECIGELSAT
ncbi:hypothetical protein COM11_25865 [Bacillus pseudomycoides]|uniref:hypothetical protein n=1 Tax=Bacillus pseudomycoides TaxID=64104 RepID=UPI000BF55EC0|nr:hypothetical protein [Bacillus pseudomycoides]PGC23088.1 hypothetical protein COM11_25865 [Bacillus pseudomycoides]